MASINASTSGVGGVITTADNTGILNIQTAGTTAITVSATQNVGVGVTPSATYKTDILYSNSANVMRLKGGASSDNCGVTFAGNVTGNLYAIGTNVSTNGNGANFDFYDLVANTNRMRIDSNGNVGIGTATPTAKVAIKCATDNFAGGFQLIKNNADNRWEYVIGSDNKLYLGYGAGVTPGGVGNFATNGTYTATSDIRKKKDITYDFNATEIVMRLKPAMGRMIDDADESPLRPFYIAQDMKEVVPSLVSSLEADQDAVDPIMGVDYASSVPLLAKMLQEQQVIIQELKAEIDLLKGAK